MELIIRYLQPGLFYLVPAFLGYLVFRFGQIVHTRKLNTQINSAWWWNLPYVFGIGFIGMFAGAVLLGSWKGLLGIELFMLAVYVFFTLGLLVFLVDVVRQGKDFFRKVWMPVAQVLAICLFSLSLWLVRSPFPLDWDLYQHQTLAKLINRGVIDFKTSEMSDTFRFNSYPPSFHVLVAAADWINPTEPSKVLGLWEGLNIWHTMVVGVVSWVLGLAVGRRKTVAFLCLVFSVLIFDTGLSMSTFFLLPQTMAAVMFTAYAASILVNIDQDRKVSWWQGLVAVVSLALVHYMVGGVSLLAYGILFFLSRFRLTNSQGLPLMLLSLVIVLALGLVSKEIDLTGINAAEAGEYVYDLSGKVSFLEQSYGYFAYLLLPIGLVACLKSKRKSVHLSLGIMAIFLVMVVSNWPYVLKLFVLSKFWISLVMAMGLGLLLEFVGSKIWKSILMGVIVVVFGANLILTSVSWKYGLLSDGEFKGVSGDEIAAASFLAENYGEKDLIISDPATQFVLEGVSGVNSAGGAYMSLDNRTHLSKAFESSDSAKIANELKNINDDLILDKYKKLLVLSGRTFVWLASSEDQKKSFGYNAWTPMGFSVFDKNVVDNLIDSGDFDLVFRNNHVLILQLKSGNE